MFGGPHEPKINYQDNR